MRIKATIISVAETGRYVSFRTAVHRIEVVASLEDGGGKVSFPVPETHARTYPLGRAVELTIRPA